METGLLSGTGARVKRVAEYLDQDTFMLTYGDGIGAVNLNELLETHANGGRLGTVTGVHPASRYGEMHVDGDAVTEFNEKPTLATGWVSGGFFVFGREMVDRYLNDDTNLMLEHEPLRKMASDGELSIHHHEGFWRGMDTYRDRMKLNQLWDRGEPQWKVWED